MSLHGDEWHTEEYLTDHGEQGGGNEHTLAEAYESELVPGSAGFMSPKDKALIDSAVNYAYPNTLIQRDNNGNFEVNCLLSLADINFNDEILSEFVNDIATYQQWAMETDGIKDIIQFALSNPETIPVDINTFSNFIFMLLYIVTEQSTPLPEPATKAARLWGNTNQIIENQASGLDSLIVFNEVLYDNADFFNPQLPYGFFVPEDGLYSIRGGVLFKAEETGRVELVLVVGEMVDGMPTLKQIENSEIKYVGANESNTAQVSSTCMLYEGDIVGLVVVNMTGDDVTVYTEAHNSPSLTITNIGNV